MKIQEVFYSVSGECGEFRQGSWVVFVRLAGCNLRCSWCDTQRAQSPDAGKEMSPDEVLAEVQRVAGGRTMRVIITGGEPLVQFESTVELCQLLTTYGYVVQVETNGSIFPPDLPVTWVMDYKLPSSGMMDKMLPIESFQNLPVGSWIKFVIADDADYEKAVSVARQLANNPELNLAFSACPPSMRHAELFRKMKADGLGDVLLSVQIHKLCALNES
jgi:7-carboxy-7-deazaguanine synthase